MAINHESPLAGHMGFSRTLEWLKEKYWWPTIRSDVENWAKSCEHCQAHKEPPSKDRNKVIMPIPVSRIFEILGMDIMGPFPETERGNQYILVLVDYLIKWPEAFPLQNGTLLILSTTTKSLAGMVHQRNC